MGNVHEIDDLMFSIGNHPQIGLFQVGELQ